MQHSRECGAVEIKHFNEVVARTSKRKLECMISPRSLAEDGQTETGQADHLLVCVVRCADYRSLIGIIGQRTRVYEVMRGARPLSLNMIRKLHSKLGIPAEVLIQSTRPPKMRAKGVTGRTKRTRRIGRGRAL